MPPVTTSGSRSTWQRTTRWQEQPSQHAEDLLHLVLGDAPVGLRPHGLATDDEGHSSGGEPRQAVDHERTVCRPGVHGAELRPGAVIWGSR